MIENTKDFWDITWSRPYGRYNRHHQDIYGSIRPFIKGKVIDIGCGAASLHQHNDYQITGVDWSISAIIEASKNVPRGTFFVLDANDEILPGEKFDTVLMMGLLDYFDDWTSVVRQAERLKADGGHIFATLLIGFNKHWWNSDLVREKLGREPKSYQHITGNWILIEI